MKELEYLAMCIFVMVAMGMATAPKPPAPLSICYSQQLTPYVNNLIQKCVVSCQKYNQDSDCNDTCGNQVILEVGEYHNQIINKFGNVL